ncbi:hypothetical protein CAPTEDRAFT_210124 [Capitella teleta]|uniref:Uncharacterized protein n=1 Tax=Capitella teleta TaxID=283909 RepID=R7TVW6_CAPTE|nr:hypothetical protein CAPTEDRAFT_210124 [Capitella teleta]|eukprot:ELT97732.1 hypothetical protein CAPTEDRAFT_210124 [Capitella teleta]
MEEWSGQPDHVWRRSPCLDAGGKESTRKGADSIREMAMEGTSKCEGKHVFRRKVDGAHSVRGRRKQRWAMLEDLRRRKHGGGAICVILDLALGLNSRLLHYASTFDQSLLFTGFLAIIYMIMDDLFNMI